MRNISANGLAKLAQKLGTEPICIISIDFAGNGNPLWFSDKTVESIPGKIIDLGNLDNVTNISGSSSSQEIAITLDDTDGTLKSIFDSYDIHKRAAKVYQYFSGLDLSDKFLLFTGTVSSPITWNERDRTVKFSIISKLESNEVGFSAEEGNFPFLPASLVGKVWPMVFGKVQNVPTVQITNAVSGTTLNGIGILSGIEVWKEAAYGDDNSSFFNSLASASIQKGHYSYVASAWAGHDAKKEQDALDQVNSIGRQISQSVTQYGIQQYCAKVTKDNDIELALADGNGGDTIQILGGEDFPQNKTLTLNINGGWFTGTFHGNVFYISSRIQNELEKIAQNIAREKTANCGQLPPTIQNIFIQSEVPCGSGDFGNPCVYTTNVDLSGTAPSPNFESTPESIPQQFWADAGATVYILGQEPKTYVVSTTPGTVLSVKAYKKFNGGQTLLEVPTDYYTVVSQNYGPITAVQVVVDNLLSTIFDPTDGVNAGWSDDLYVTFESTIGPDIIAIIKYLIETHSDLTWDATTFNHCATKLSPFPANFAILSRQDIIQVLQEIAFQSRCAIWLDDDVFKMSYLPEVPSPVDSITISDIDAENGVEISLTPTESLVTKMQVNWRMSLAAFIYGGSPDLIMILRHNVLKYGRSEQSFDWYIFNQPDIIYKMATFWMIRNSITWKTVKFQTYLNKLNLEVFDAITLNLPQVATGSVVALITKASYNSEGNCIDVECALPIEAGSMVTNPFYWPAALAGSVTWPTQADIDSGNAGGGLYGDVTGPLPVGDTSSITLPGDQVIIVGGPNVVFGAHSSWGDATPTDTGFTAQTALDPAWYSNVGSGTRPLLFTQNRTLKSLNPLILTNINAGLTIDIRKTVVVDSYNPGRKSHLQSFIYGISTETDSLGYGALTLDRLKCKVADQDCENGQPLSDVFKNGEEYLSIRTDCSIWDSTHTEDAQFDWEFNADETGKKKWGAGTAFLKD